MKTIVSIAKYYSPMGEILIGCSSDDVWLCSWCNSLRLKRVINRLDRLGNVEFVEGRTGVTDVLCGQLDEYFAGKRSVFCVPLKTYGSSFQSRVWEALTDVPYGTKISYGTLARRMGCATSVRAVASALGDNALCLLLPCHRVISADGSVGGYAGSVEVKRKLLALEN